MQLLFKAARLANERALAHAAADPARPPPVRPAHTALFPHLDFDGIRQTELAMRVGITKQAVGQLVDDLVGLGMVERVSDPSDKRARRVRFSHQGYLALLRGLTILRELEATLGAAIGKRRMREFHRTLRLLIEWLERSAPVAGP